MIHNLKEKAEHIPFQKKTEKRENKKLLIILGLRSFLRGESYHVNTASTKCVKCTHFTKNVRVVHRGISGSYKYIKKQNILQNTLRNNTQRATSGCMYISSNGTLGLP